MVEPVNIVKRLGVRIVIVGLLTQVGVQSLAVSTSLRVPPTAG